MKLPNEIEKVLQELTESGYEAYLVGGAVRDFLLGTPPVDYDVCTSAPCEELNRIFKDYKLFQTGVKSGTVTVILNSVRVEVTTYRGDSLESDLILRDFTVNSICYNNDYLANDVSFEDLNNKVIRVWDIDKTFQSDPLRILRAIRLSYSYNFSIEEQTQKSMFKYMHLLSEVAAERIRDEFCKIIMLDNPREIIEKYFKIFLQFIPELESMQGFSKNNPYHVYDVLTHTLVALENSSRELEIRIAILFHDIGKPDTHEVIDGVSRFYNHPERGVEILEVILNRLKFSNESKQTIKNLVRYHDYAIECRRKSVRRALNKVGDNFEKLMELKRCDILAQNPKYIGRLETLKEIDKIAKSIVNNEEGYNLKSLDITGKDVMELGYEGKEIGKILNEILILVIDGELENRLDVLYEYVRKMRS